MNSVSCDVCVYHVWFVCVFSSEVFVSPRVTGACPVTTDLIMRVNVRTTTTATGSCRASSYKYHRSLFLGLDLDPIFLRCNYRIKYRYSRSHSVPASTLHGGHDGRCHP